MAQGWEDCVPVKTRDELKTMFSNSAYGLNYEPVVRELAKEHPEVKRILEWGPGASTLLFSELWPEAEIVGIEHDAKWMAKCRELSRSLPRVTMMHEPISLHPGQNGRYVTLPLYLPKFDFIFVDGRHRCECLAVAPICLNEGGVVVLHDAHRTAYHPALRWFSEVLVTGQTMVLRTSSESRS